MSAGTVINWQSGKAGGPSQGNFYDPADWVKLLNH